MLGAVYVASVADHVDNQSIGRVVKRVQRPVVANPQTEHAAQLTSECPMGDRVGVLTQTAQSVNCELRLSFSETRKVLFCSGRQLDAVIQEDKPSCCATSSRLRVASPFSTSLTDALNSAATDSRNSRSASASLECSIAILLVLSTLSTMTLHLTNASLCMCLIAS